MAKEAEKITRILITRTRTQQREGWTVSLETGAADSKPKAIPIVFNSLVAALSAITETVEVNEPPTPSVVVINGLRLDGHLRSALDFAISGALQKLQKHGGQIPEHASALHDDLLCLSEILRPPQDN